MKVVEDESKGKSAPIVGMKGDDAVVDADHGDHEGGSDTELKNQFLHNRV